MASDTIPPISALQFFLSAVAHWVERKEIDQEVKRQLPSWYNSMSDLAKTLKLKTKTLHTILQGASAGGKIKPVVMTALDDLGDQLKTAFVYAKRDNTITHEQLANLGALGTYFRTNSEASFKRVTQGVLKMTQLDLKRMFFDVEDSGQDQTKDFRAIKRIVKTLTGDDRHRLTPEEAQKFFKHRDKGKAQAYEDYKKHNLALRNAYRAQLKRIVSASGEHFLPIKQVRAEMKDAGVSVDFLPKGFDALRIGPDERLYTKTGKVIRGSAAGIDVTPNPSYDANKDNTYVFKATGIGRVAETNYYTEDWWQRSSKRKFETVDKAMSNLPQVMKKWRKDLLHGADPDAILGLMAEIEYQTQARVGGAGNATDGKATYGLTTLLVKHIKDHDKYVSIIYPGKSGVKQKHRLPGTSPIKRAAIAELQKLLKNKKPSDYVFTYKGKRLTEQKINEYLRSIGFKSTIHKIRHIKGSQLAEQIMEDSNFKLPKTSKKDPQKLAEDWFRLNVATKVAQILGHKKATGEDLPMTSVKNYIDPALSHKFFLDRGLRIPKWVPGA